MTEDVRPPFQYVGVMREEAIELQSALERARILHTDKDIDSGGHHYEDAVRNVLTRRLPGQYHLGKGHIVDHGWASSREFDIVIADVAAGSIFFTASDGTNYYPFEGVYGVGEVKSSFRRKAKQLPAIVNSITDLKTRLRREQTPSNFVPGIGPVPQVTSGWPYRNPLFTFAFFGEGGNVKLEDVVKAYEGIPWSCLPNIVCFLDKGVVGLFEMTMDASGAFHLGSWAKVPEFADTSGNKLFTWAFVPMGGMDVRQAANLATLHWMIVAHMESVALMPAKADTLHAYLTNAALVNYDDLQAVAATRPAGDTVPETLRG
jgi:hypothetical protein